MSWDAARRHYHEKRGAAGGGEADCREKECTMNQLAFRWIDHEELDAVPIPDTTKIANLDFKVTSLLGHSKYRTALLDGKRFHSRPS